MRLALISDIHANHVALETVLAHVDANKPDALICLGDVATIGPQPNRVLDTLRSLGCVCLRGNHDDVLLQPEMADALNIARPLFPSLSWTMSKIGAKDLEFLESFPGTYCLSLDDNVELLCFHGSPRNNTDQILATTMAADLDEMISPSSAQILAGGHTHIQMLRQHHGRLVINTGSVGHGFLQVPVDGDEPSLLPWAEYATVEYQNGAVAVTLHRLPYNMDALLDAVKASDMPEDVQRHRLRQYQDSLRYVRHPSLP